MKNVMAKAVLTATLVVPAYLSAAPIFHNSSTVSNATNTATFDSITQSGINLNNYIEGGLNLSVNDTSWVNFDAFNRGAESQFYYGRGGNTSWVNISLSNSNPIYSLDFLLGDGWSGPTTNLIWETFNGANSTGFGDVIIERGSTVGWLDADGFTSIRVAAHTTNIDSFGAYQAIALDDLRVSTDAISISEPSAIALLGLGLFGLGYSRKKSKA